MLVSMILFTDVQSNRKPPNTPNHFWCGRDGKTDQCACILATDRLRRDEEARKAAIQAADDGWVACDERLRKRDEATAKAWKEEIDTSLIFVSETGNFAVESLSDGVALRLVYFPRC